VPDSPGSAARPTGRAPFVHAVQPQFYQADPAGVLFYGRVFELFHQAYAAFVEHVGIDYATHFGIRDYAVPIVHAEADCRAPIRPGERLAVEVVLERLGDSSITLSFAIRGPDGTIRATGREVHVAVDPRDFSKRPLPGSLRDAMSPWIADEPAPGGVPRDSAGQSETAGLSRPI
jgi:acyl-CoA thioesterase FadM